MLWSHSLRMRLGASRLLSLAPSSVFWCGGAPVIALSWSSLRAPRNLELRQKKATDMQKQFETHQRGLEFAMGERKDFFPVAPKRCD